MIHTVVGNGGGFSGDGGLATNAQLAFPRSIAIGSNGELYIADGWNNRIRKVAPNGLISTIAGDGRAGLSGDGGLAIHAQLWCPQGIAVDLNGEVYIVDTGNHRVCIISPDGLISTIAGNGSLGLSGDGGEAIHAQLNYPESIAVSESGEIYIADTHNHRIRKISPNGLISTIAGNGTQGLNGDGGEATKAQLDSPGCVAVSSNGEVYIADSGNHRIRKISSDGLIWTIAGNGSPGFNGDGGLATKARLQCPEGITIGPGGEIYISDTHNHRIRKISKNGLISTIAGNGEKGFSGDGGLATKAQLDNPESIAISPSGEIYIADRFNDRIRKIDALYPNGPIMGTSLNRYERDDTPNGFKCFLPLLAKLAPTFYGTILKADTLALNANEKQIMQHLIDLSMYGTELDPNNLEGGDGVDWLFVLGMIGGSQFFEVKTKLLPNFMDACTEDSISLVLERLDTLKEKSTTENSLLSQMMDYALGRAALALRSSPTLATNPIIHRHLVQILTKMYQTEVAPITLSDTIREETHGIESLFNDSTTSDIKILLGEKQFYCHQTVLSSRSPYFNDVFGNGKSFNDVENGAYRVDCTEFGEELHEVVIKYCYNLLDESAISESVAVPLFQCASFYRMSQLVDYTATAIGINVENYFELVDQLGHCLCEVLCSRFVEFGFSNLKLLGMTQEKMDSLPEQVQKKLFWKCMQEKI